MGKTIQKLLIKTDEIEVYSNIEYDTEFLERLVSYYTKHKEKILFFFQVKEFRKIRVNLFESKQTYDDAFKSVMQISKYGIGNCYRGEINYVCTKEDLASFSRARFYIWQVLRYGNK